MVDLLSRPLLRVEATPPRSVRPLALAAALVSVWVAAVGLLGCVVLAVAAWFTGDSGTFADAVRVGATGWLVANGSGLQVAGETVGVIPLGAVLFVGVLLERGARRACGRWGPASGRDAGIAVVAMSLTYLAIVLVTALLVGQSSAQVPLARAALAALTVSSISGAIGLIRGSGHAETLLSRLPDDARAALEGGLVGLALMVGAGALAVTVALLLHFSEAVELAEGLGAGIVGGFVISVVGMALLPNAVLCAGAFLAGPGFVVGEGTVVAPGAVELGALPPLPMLAALPHSADGWWVELAAMTPVLAGIGAGTLALLRHPVFHLDRAALRGGLAGVVGGLGFGGLCWLATGSVGPGRMKQVGPDVLSVLAVCTVAGLVGGALAGFAVRWIQGARRVRTPDEETADQAGPAR